MLVPAIVMGMIVCFLVLLIPSSTPAQDKTIRWKVQTPYPTAVPYVARTAKMFDRIKVMTGGRLDAKFSPGSIVPAYSEWDAMQKGLWMGPSRFPPMSAGSSARWATFQPVPGGTDGDRNGFLDALRKRGRPAPGSYG